MKSKSHYVNSVTLKKKKTLGIDLGDTYVTVVEVGIYDKRIQYQWTSISPTEGLIMDHSSEIIEYDSLVLRLDMLSEDLKDEEYHAIKMFLGEK